MADVAGAARPLPRRVRLPASGVVLVALAALAWAATIAWANSRDMSAMPGTMGLGLGEFVAMWALMMTAMMLPSVWPFVAVYERTIRAHRVARLGALAGGYLLAWALVGVVAYGVAWVFGELAADRPGLARVVGGGRLRRPRHLPADAAQVPLPQPLPLTARPPAALHVVQRSAPRPASRHRARPVLPRVLLGADAGARRLRRDEPARHDRRRRHHRRGEGVALRRGVRPRGRRERAWSTPPSSASSHRSPRASIPPSS